MQLSCEKKDAIPMKNRLVSLKHRCDKLTQRSNERTRTLNAALVKIKIIFELKLLMVNLFIYRMNVNCFSTPTKNCLIGYSSNRGG